MADALVLDTSACLALLEDEAGADVVETHLVDAREGRIVTRVGSSLFSVEELPDFGLPRQGHGWFDGAIRASKS